MKQVTWIQRVYIDGKVVAEFERMNTIGERRSYNIFTPELERKRVTAEFVEPGMWKRV